jgi:hypothetical protein
MEAVCFRTYKPARCFYLDHQHRQIIIYIVEMGYFRVTRELTRDCWVFVDTVGLLNLGE